MKQKYRSVLALLVAMVFCLVSCTAVPQSPVGTPDKIPGGETAASSFSVTFLDVGQGDGALITCDGKSMVIDGGGKECSSMMYAVLQARNITELELVVCSHAHEDSVGGLPGALQFATAKEILSPTASYDSEAFRDVLKIAAEKHIPFRVPSAGETFSLGTAQVEILQLNAGDSTNDASIYLMVTFDGVRFLFTGDGEIPAEKALTETYPPSALQAEVLKVGHHGSSTSTTEELLQAVRPQVAVLSVGTGNSYGHPTAQTLERLERYGVEVYRTDQQGDVTMTVENGVLSVSVRKNGGTTVYENTPEAEVSQSASAKTYVLNTASKKFHVAGCSALKEMSPQNRQDYVGDRAALEAQGYVPCKICKP